MTTDPKNKIKKTRLIKKKPKTVIHRLPLNPTSSIIKRKVGRPRKVQQVAELAQNPTKIQFSTPPVFSRQFPTPYNLRSQDFPVFPQTIYIHKNEKHTNPIWN